MFQGIMDGLLADIPKAVSRLNDILFDCLNMVSS